MRAPDHHVDQLVRAGRGDLRGCHELAVAQHGDAVGELEHLLQAVADVDDADAARAQQAHDAEQVQHVVARSAPRSARP